MTAKPVMKTISGGDVLRTKSRQDINDNFAAQKAAIDSLVDEVNGITSSGTAPYRQLWNGSAYPARPSTSIAPNGMVERVGPVPPSDNLSRDQWIETDS